jgi:hypothetical protein
LQAARFIQSRLDTPATSDDRYPTASNVGWQFSFDITDFFDEPVDDHFECVPFHAEAVNLFAEPDDFVAHHVHHKLLFARISAFRQVTHVLFEFVIVHGLPTNPANKPMMTPEPRPAR